MTMGGSTGDIVLDQLSPLREDETRFYAIIVHELNDEQVELTTIEWPKRSFDEWWSETRGTLAPEPEGLAFDFRLPKVVGSDCIDDTWTPTLQLLDPRYWHTAVWTGSEMIVYGGMEAVGTIYGDGSRYDPATDTWTLLPTTGSPGRRQSHVAVWSGSEMIVWGGAFDPVGGRYDPVSDTWAPTSSINAPAPRWNASVVWTGTEMIVWGGNGGGFVLNDGGRYRPETDTWATMPAAPLEPREYHAAAWTGIAAGGLGRVQRLPRTDVRGRRALRSRHRLLDAGHRRQRAQRALLPHGRLDRQRDDRVGRPQLPRLRLERGTLRPRHRHLDPDQPGQSPVPALVPRRGLDRHRDDRPGWHARSWWQAAATIRPPTPGRRPAP